MKISLVINTYNRMHSLPNTMESLQFLRYRDLEVIVVDGPSNDGTSSYLKLNWGGKVKICSCAEANLSKSRNVGVANASGEIVCFIDDDGVPEPDWLDNLAQAYDDPGTGAAGGWVRNHTGVDFQTKYIVSSRDSTSETLVEDSAAVPTCEPYAPKFPGLIGVNSSFRRSVLMEIGGFDEEYAYFLDETDVLVRLIDAGYKVRQIPHAEVHHKYAASHIRTLKGTARSWLQIMTSTAYFIIKSAPPKTPLYECFEKIDWHKRNLKTHTDWYLSENIVNQAKHAELISEIENGARQGIEDAFRYPSRRLLQDASLTEWLPFPRLLNHGKRLRIAFVTALYPPRPCGGVAIFIYHLARKLAEQGHEITVVTQAEEGRGHTVDFEEGVWVHRLPNDESMAISKPKSMPEMPHEQTMIACRVLAELERVDRHRKFQCVIGAIWDLDLAAVIASKRFVTAMYLVTSYKLMEDSKPEWKLNTSYYDGHVKKMIHAETWALKNVDRVLASTTAILRDTEEAYGLKLPAEKISVVPFGVPRPRAVPLASRSDHRIKLLYVGRFEQRKGADLILNVLPELLGRYQNLEVICIGDNQICNPLTGRTYTEDFLTTNKNADWLAQVHFLGHVDEDALEAAYASCDIFMAPSRYESFGLIYLEAMRFGKPCIGSDAGGIPEVVKDGETGILIGAGDAEDLKRAIGTLVENKELRENLGRRGLERYNAQFTTEKFSAEIAALVYKWLSLENLEKVA